MIKILISLLTLVTMSYGASGSSAPLTKTDTTIAPNAESMAFFFGPKQNFDDIKYQQKALAITAVVCFGSKCLNKCSNLGHISRNVASFLWPNTTMNAFKLDEICTKENLTPAEVVQICTQKWFNPYKTRIINIQKSDKSGVVADKNGGLWDVWIPFESERGMCYRRSEHMGKKLIVHNLEGPVSFGWDKKNNQPEPMFDGGPYVDVSTVNISSSRCFYKDVNDKTRIFYINYKPLHNHEQQHTDQK